MISVKFKIVSRYARINLIKTILSIQFQPSPPPQYQITPLGDNHKSKKKRVGGGGYNKAGGEACEGHKNIWSLLEIGRDTYAWSGIAYLALGKYFCLNRILWNYIFIWFAYTVGLLVEPDKNIQAFCDQIFLGVVGSFWPKMQILLPL